MSYNRRFPWPVWSLSTVVAVVAAVAALSGPPQMRELKFADTPTSEALSPAAAQPEGGQAFYYSGGKKVFLTDTGLAVAKLKNPRAEDKNLKFQPATLALNSPLAEMEPALRRSGFVI